MSLKSSLCSPGIGLLALGLVACASAPLAQRSAPASPLVDDSDAYIATVERIARDRGVQVIWVNPPRRTP